MALWTTLLASCPPSDSASTDLPPVCDEPCAATVEVSPGEVHAGPGAKVQLTATGRDANGEIIDPPPATSWTGAPVTEAILNRATVAATGTGPILIQAKMGAVSSLKAKIIISSGSASPSADILDVDHQSGTPPSIVLLDGKASGDPDCSAANDRKLAVAGVATLPVNLVAGCANELAVFDPARAPLIEDLGLTAWTDGAETLRRVPTAPLTMPVKVWYFVLDGTPDVTGKLELLTAQTIFNENRVGLRYTDPVDHVLMPISKAYTGDEKCTGIEELLGFDADQSTFHVVYVTSIAWLSEPLAWACPDDPGRGDVVIIAETSNWLPTITGHEMVHRMGFATPPFEFSTSGHVTDLAEFDQTNLMWSPIDPLDYGDRFYLTLGQVYRIHAAPESWLNRAKIRPAGSTTRPCPKEMVSGVCPALSMGPQVP